MSAKKKWQATLAEVGRGWDAAGGGTVSSHKDRARLILKGANYATMLAYLWRRFGPPPTGWDDHKELVNYWITTPVKGIAFGLSCSPSFESCGAGVFYAIDKRWANKVRKWESGESRRWLQSFANTNLIDDLYTASQVENLVCGDTEFIEHLPSPNWFRYAQRLYREHEMKEGPRPDRRWFDEWPDMEFGFDRPPVPLDKLEAGPHREILTAIEAGLRDLLRPVPIRDTLINACGRVDDSQWKRAVERYPDAGYGCRTKKEDAK